ncbi:MAG: glycosyltransferase family 9 protein [Verrucomicrobiota bacterium]|jgi:ADP-heptose:LPS heptosyltransferase
MTPAFTRKLLAALLAGRRPGGTRQPPRRLKACVFKLDGIGDFVLALGAVRQILDHYGEAQCALVVSKSAADLARSEFPRAAVLGFPQFTGGMKSMLALYFGHAAQLGGYSFEKLISLRYQRTTFHHLALSWINASHSVSFANTPDLLESDKTIYQFLLTERLPLPMHAPPGFSLELERHRKIVEHIRQQETTMAGILPRFTSFVPKTGADLIVTPYGGSPIRDYAEDKLIAVLKEVSRSVAAPIRLCGGPAERTRLGRLGAALRSQGVANISVEIPKSLVEFAQRVADAKAVLTVETSTAHLAAALDKPAVILIGGGHFGLLGPWQRSSKQRWLTNQLPCFGCDWRCIYPEIRCLSEIPPSAVARALLDACLDV